jgi:hypothetical protein
VARKAKYTETNFVLRLADLRVENTKDWPAEAIHFALKVVAETEKARAAHPQALPWVKEQRAQADRQRKEGEEALLMGKSPANWEKARKLLATALGSLQAINQQLEVIQAAQRSRDEAMVLLPGYLPYLEFDSNLELPWQQAMKTALELHEVLTPPAKPDAVLTERIGKMGELTGTWQTLLKRLRQPLEPSRLKQKMDQTNRPVPDDWWEMNALLGLPWLSARERAALWPAWRGLASRLQKETLASGLPSFDSDTAQRMERNRALLRARGSFTLLQMAQALSDDGTLTEEEKKGRAENLAKVSAILGRTESHAGEKLGPLELQLRQAWSPYRNTFLQGK